MCTSEFRLAYFHKSHFIILLSRKSISSISPLSKKLKLGFGPCSFKAQKNPQNPSNQTINWFHGLYNFYFREGSWPTLYFLSPQNEIP